MFVRIREVGGPGGGYTIRDIPLEPAMNDEGFVCSGEVSFPPDAEFDYQYVRKSGRRTRNKERREEAGKWTKRRSTLQPEMLIIQEDNSDIWSSENKVDEAGGAMASFRTPEERRLSDAHAGQVLMKILPPEKHYELSDILGQKVKKTERRKKRKRCFAVYAQRMTFTTPRSPNVE